MSLEVKTFPLGNTIDVELEAKHATIRQFLLQLFATLEKREISYCLLRDGDRLDRLWDSNEIDLLIQEDHLDGLRMIAAGLGFVSLPSWGYAPHHFFLKYDEAADRWLKLDVVTDLYYGRPVRALRTALAAQCLERRQRIGPTYIPAAEDEVITLLLHCVLDKGRFDPARRERLQTLSQKIIDRQYLSSRLASYWAPSMTWTQLAVLIDNQDWDALLAQEKAIVAQISERDQFGTAARQLRARVLRKLNRWAGFWQPRVPMVGLLAPDGAGKTTLAAGIKASSYFAVRPIYMGLYQKQNSRSRRFRIPGLGIIGNMLTQWRRYLSARYHQGRGRLVIFDRYTYDALLPTRQTEGILRRIRRWLLANACPPPDLVIILDAPGDLLYARKGEHTVAILEEQRQGYLQLRSHLPHCAIIDAGQDSDAVRRKAMSLIWRKFSGYVATSGSSQ